MGRPDFTDPVERPADAALRSANVQFERSFGDVASGSDSEIINVNSVNGKKALDRLSFRSGDDKTLRWDLIIRVGDSEGSTIAWDYVVYPYGIPNKFDPAIHVPDGGDISVFARQDSGSSQGHFAAIMYRDL